MVKNGAHELWSALKNRGFLVTSIMAILLGSAALFAPWDVGLRALSFDLIAELTAPPRPADVVVIFMDEESRERFQQPIQGPWDRTLHARLLRELKHRGAGLVAFDVLFDQPSIDPA